LISDIEFPFRFLERQHEADGRFAHGKEDMGVGVAHAWVSFVDDLAVADDDIGLRARRGMGDVFGERQVTQRGVPFGQRDGRVGRGFQRDRRPGMADRGRRVEVGEVERGVDSGIAGRKERLPSPIGPDQRDLLVAEAGFRGRHGDRRGGAKVRRN